MKLDHKPNRPITQVMKHKIFNYWKMKMEDVIFLNVFLYNQLNIIIFTFTIYMPKASPSHEVFHLKRHHHILFFQTPSHPHVYTHTHTHAYVWLTSYLGSRASLTAGSNPIATLQCSICTKPWIIGTIQGSARGHWKENA